MNAANLTAKAPPETKRAFTINYTNIALLLSQQAPNYPKAGL